MYFVCRICSDLMPVIQCLKLDNLDAVEQCMDNISPWMEITDEGELNFSLNAVNGFIGGSVGVLGTVASTMIKKNQVKDRLKCTYCDGTGQILCGHCLGSGTLMVADDSGAMVSKACPNCEGSGTVVCINCQGSGLAVPDEFLAVLGDEEVGFTEEDYIGLFDETPIPKAPVKEVAAVGTSAPNSPTAAAPTAAPPNAAAAPKTDARARPQDYTGGAPLASTPTAAHRTPRAVRACLHRAEGRASTRTHFGGRTGRWTRSRRSAPPQHARSTRAGARHARAAPRRPSAMPHALAGMG